MTERAARRLTASDLQVHNPSPIGSALKPKSLKLLIDTACRRADAKPRSKCIRVAFRGRIFWIGHSSFGPTIHDANGLLVAKVIRG